MYFVLMHGVIRSDVGDMWIINQCRGSTKRVENALMQLLGDFYRMNSSLDAGVVR